MNSYNLLHRWIRRAAKRNGSGASPTSRRVVAAAAVLFGAMAAACVADGPPAEGTDVATLELIAGSCFAADDAEMPAFVSEQFENHYQAADELCFAADLEVLGGEPDGDTSHGGSCGLEYGGCGTCGYLNWRTVKEICWDFCPGTPPGPSVPCVAVSYWCEPC